MREPYTTDLSDEEWSYIEPHLPAPKGYGRPRTHTLREILNAVFYLLRSGYRWRLLPHDCGMGAQGPGLERRSRRASEEALPRRGVEARWAAEWAKEGVTLDW